MKKVGIQLQLALLLFTSLLESRFTESVLRTIVTSLGLCKFNRRDITLEVEVCTSPHIWKMSTRRLDNFQISQLVGKIDY